MKKIILGVIVLGLLIMGIGFAAAENFGSCTINSDCAGSTSCINRTCLANDCISNEDCIDGWYCNSGKCAVVNGVNSIEINFSCTKDSDCKINICGQNSCVSKDYQTPQGVGCAFPLEMRAEYCKCENNKCVGEQNKSSCGNGICERGACAGIGCPTPENSQNCPQDCATGSCGNNICDGNDNQYCPEDCGNKTSNLVGNDRDSHGCIGSAGYSWCEEKQKCLRVWEENCTAVCGDSICNSDEKAVLCVDPGLYPNGSMMPGGGCNMVCPQDCNKTLPGTGKQKILPETASLRARERLGELGFNITLKIVPIGVDKANDTLYKSVYVAEAEKEGKMLGLFKVKGKVSADIDAETGEVLKVHKPWWGFLAGI